MNNMIKIFESKEFGKVRTVVRNGETWWILKDICRVLEMKANSAGEVVKRFDKDEYDSIGLTDSLGRKQKAYVVSESGLYSILVRSDKPKAKPFRKWITTEVLPTIRRTGGYVSNEEMFIENYLPFLDEPYRDLFRIQMTIIGKLNERTEIVSRSGLIWPPRPHPAELRFSRLAAPFFPPAIGHRA